MKFCITLRLGLLVFQACACWTSIAWGQSELANRIGELSIQSIQESISDIEEQLNELPLRNIRESGGTIGFGTISRRQDPSEDWVEVDLGASKKFDAVVLVPCVWINELQESYDYGFPAAYKVWAYENDQDRDGVLVYDSEADPFNRSPKMAPIVIGDLSIKAKRVRVTVLGYTREPDKNREVFSLGELMVFDGEQNLALGKPVSASSSNEFEPMWGKAYLTDGYMPYSYPRNREVFKNNFCLMRLESADVLPSITIDLGEEHELSEVRLYAVHLGRNYLAVHRTAQGFPKQFLIEASSSRTFDDAVTIFETDGRDYPTPGVRVAMFPVEDVRGRFLRVTALKTSMDPKTQESVMAFAEIEILSRGEVISRGSEVLLSHEHSSASFIPRMFVDGRAGFSKILPLRSWLYQLAERRNLENYLGALKTELDIRFHRQSILVQFLWGGLVLAILAGVIAVLWLNLLKQRRLHRLRESIAADLHDEIGGNLSGIALLCDQMFGSVDLSKRHVPLVRTIAEVSRQTSENTREFVRFLESRDDEGALFSRMETTAAKVLVKTDYRFDVEGAKQISFLSSKQKWHLLLFFKEALTNVVKHAKATDVVLKLEVTSRDLILKVIDNGVGLLLDGKLVKMPDHLGKRAAKLDAALEFSTPSNGGTEVRLIMKL